MADDFSAQDIAQRQADHQLQLAPHNLPAGNWAGHERGIWRLMESINAFGILGYFVDRTRIRIRPLPWDPA